jgi:hypothetical protein
MTSDLLIPERVRRCHQSLTRYSDDDHCICLIDLLADAMHWCDANGEDFLYALAVAGKHYITELKDEQSYERSMS